MTRKSGRRSRTLSVAMIGMSMALSVGVSLTMDALLLAYSTYPPAQTLVAVMLFNGTVILQSAVGGIIEWRRPGHGIGLLLLLSGPLYAVLAAGWMTGDILQPRVDPSVYQWVILAAGVLSWPGVALIAGWVPLLFPTGTLPGPRWRIPAGILVIVSSIGLVALAVRPGPLYDGGPGSPIAIDAWPGFLQAFVDAIPLELVGLMLLAVAALIVRYRRGDRVERLQVRWFFAAVALCVVGFAATVVEAAFRTDNGPLVGALVSYAGILLMPVAIGIAILRYRLFEIDRIVSRTIGWALVTGLLLGLFAASVVGLQAILAGVNQGQTLAVAASTLVAFVLFQPVRRRVQSVVDRRFNRARYNAEGTAAAFAERQRNQVDIAGLKVDLTGTIDSALHPTALGVWIRRSGIRGTP